MFLSHLPQAARGSSERAASPGSRSRGQSIFFHAVCFLMKATFRDTPTGEMLQPSES
jgi:hypothetical protein